MVGATNVLAVVRSTAGNLLFDSNDSLPHDQGQFRKSVHTRLVEGEGASVINKATKYRRWLLEGPSDFVFIQLVHFRNKFHSTLEERTYFSMIPPSAKRFTDMICDVACIHPG